MDILCCTVDILLCNDINCSTCHFFVQQKDIDVCFTQVKGISSKWPIVNLPLIVISLYFTFVLFQFSFIICSL